ncbi:MAG: zinc ribbon domain-containing protein [Erysipelotrichaceae bacterium]|nr:zinc ribbon domain-containing protein [Erysipelotrichaceae bacterium]
MFFLIGINQESEELEHDQMMVCDNCGSYGRYRVFMTYMVFTFFFIPLFKWDRHYFVETSCCHSLYELSEEKGIAIKDHERVEITSEDLRPVNVSNRVYKKCATCGYGTVEDFEFCPKCGKRF